MSSSHTTGSQPPVAQNSQEQNQFGNTKLSNICTNLHRWLVLVKQPRIHQKKSNNLPVWIMPQRAAWTRKHRGKFLQPALQLQGKAQERKGEVGRERTCLGRADVPVTSHFYCRVWDTVCIVQKIITPSFQLRLTALNYFSNVTSLHC